MCEWTMTGDMAFTVVNIYCILTYLSSARFALNSICGTGTDDRIAPRISVDKVNSISIMAFYWKKSRKSSRMDDAWHFYAAYAPRPVYTPVSIAVSGSNIPVEYSCLVSKSSVSVLYEV